MTAVESDAAAAVEAPTAEDIAVLARQEYLTITEFALVLKVKRYWLAERVRLREVPFCLFGRVARFSLGQRSAIEAMYEQAPGLPASPAAACGGVPEADFDFEEAVEQLRRRDERLTRA